MFFFWPLPFIIFIYLALKILPRILKFALQLGSYKFGNFPGHQSPRSTTEDLKIKSGSPEVREKQIFHAAKKLKGRLTLSDIVMETDMSLTEAEKAIHRIVDEIHVRMVVKSNGLIIYEFPEIMARFQEGHDFYKDI